MDNETRAAYVPPHSTEAERSVLGSMFLDPKAVFIAIERLRAEDFYSKRNSQVFETMCELSETGNPIDTVTVVDRMERKKQISGSDDAVYIADLSASVPSASNIEYYIDIVEEKSLLRALVGVGNDIIKDAMSSEDETADIINRAGDLIYKITVKRNRDSLEHIRPALVDGYNIIGASVKNKTGMLGIPTGFKQLDNMLSGFQGSQLIIVAGRPGVGKTSIALNMAQNIAIKSKVPVALFSLEMSREQLAMRMMCSEALVDSEKIRHGSVTDEDFDNLSQAVKSLADAPLYVDDTPTITVMEMLAKARRLKQEKGLGLVVIDYLQLMTGSNKRENRQQEVAGMTRSLKIMAKEINVPILLLSQLSRAVEQRETKRPQLSDLRESGSIEQDADVVMFLSRDKEAEQTGSNEIRLIVAKQRSGPTGDIVLGYRGEYTRFVELNN